MFFCGKKISVHFGKRTRHVHFVSEKLLVVLRDGRTLIGILRSIDQFGKPFSVIQ